MRYSNIFKISQGCWTKWDGLDDLQMPLPTLKILWIYDSVLVQHNVEKHGIGSTENLSSSDLAARGKVGHRKIKLFFQCKNKNVI